MGVNVSINIAVALAGLAALVMLLGMWTTAKQEEVSAKKQETLDVIKVVRGWTVLGVFAI